MASPARVIDHPTVHSDIAGNRRRRNRRREGRRAEDLELDRRVGRNDEVLHNIADRRQKTRRVRPRQCLPFSSYTAAECMCLGVYIVR